MPGSETQGLPGIHFLGEERSEEPPSGRNRRIKAGKLGGGRRPASGDVSARLAAWQDKKRQPPLCRKGLPVGRVSSPNRRVSHDRYPVGANLTEKLFVCVGSRGYFPALNPPQCKKSNPGVSTINSVLHGPGHLVPRRERDRPDFVKKSTRED